VALLNEAAVEVCQYFDKDVTKVIATLGWEQEYFLVDAGLFMARPDLQLTGRTLMGHASAKDQHLKTIILEPSPAGCMPLCAILNMRLTS
jgi:glutamine synthetase